MNRLKVFLLGFVLLIGLGFSVLAHETATIEEIVNLDENIQPEDLGVSEPRLLPDSPFYFLKNWGRAVRSFFAFNPIDRAELRIKFASEKLMELKKMIEEKKNSENIKKASENYQKEIEKIREETERIREKARENPKVESFLDKFIHQQTLHQKLLDRLATQVPAEAFEKIKEARERHLERFKDVMLKLEDRQEKITEKVDKILEEQKGSQFKHFKNLEVLKNLEEKVPEKAKEAIRKAEENALKRLQGNLEKMSPEDQEKFKEYIEKISGEKERHLELLENLRQEIQVIPAPPPAIRELKQKLEEGREGIIKKMEEKRPPICPLMPLKIPPCPKGRIIEEKNEQGCIIGLKCILTEEIKYHHKVIPGSKCQTDLDCSGYLKELEVPKGIEVKCLEEKCVLIGTPAVGIPEIPPQRIPPEEDRRGVCIALWDPVCGKDGKTYSNECFAKLAGVEIDYKGVCQEKMPSKAGQ